MKAKPITVAESAEPMPAWAGEPPTEAPPPAAPERATAEHWAERAGMAERFLAPSGEFARPNPAYQDWAQARAYHGWPQGFELTEAEFRAAIEAAKSHTFR